MERKKLLKLIIGVSLVAVLAVAIPLMSGCAAPAPTPTPEPTPTPTPEPTPTPTPEPAEELPTWHLRCPTVASATDLEQHAGQWRDDIYQMTDGRITIDLYSSYELLPDEQIMNAMKAGTIDCSMYMCYVNPVMTQTGWVEGDLPYGIRNPTEFEVLYRHRGLREIFEQDYADFGVKYVGRWQYDPVSTMISTKPIRTLDDFKGLKLASFEPLGGISWVGAGAVMINIPPDEMYLAGKTGTCDAVGWGGAHQYSVMGLPEAYPYYLSNSAAGALVGCMIFNMELWESFGPAIQAIIECATDKASAMDATFKYDGESWGRLEYAEVTTLSDEDEAVLRSYAYEYWEVRAAENELARRVVEIYVDYNDELEKTKWWRTGEENTAGQVQLP